MKRKLSASLVGAVVCGFLSVCCSIGAVAADGYIDYRVSYKKCPQERSNWCWLAGAECSAKVLNPSSTRSQSDAYKYVNNTLVAWNNPGTIAQTAEAATYISCDMATYRSSESALAGEFFILQLIDGRMPIIGSIGDDSVGHITPVPCMRFRTSDGTKYWYVYDPAADVEHMFTGTQLYNGQPGTNARYVATCWYQ